MYSDPSTSIYCLTIMVLTRRTNSKSCHRHNFILFPNIPYNFTFKICSIFCCFPFSVHFLTYLYSIILLLFFVNMSVYMCSSSSCLCSPYIVYRVQKIIPCPFVSLLLLSIALSLVSFSCVLFAFSFLFHSLNL